MQCQYGHSMIPLFTSWVCEQCDAPQAPSPPASGFRRYRAMRDITLSAWPGQPKVHCSDIVEFDGSNLRWAGREGPYSVIKSAIVAGWFEAV